ncbi:Oxo-4-hydroxy-4-carboxy-5-ureidoimidazoline decarboxylase [Penicillium canariense]|uniref:Oxo-4-hydroxy-4-carboxy-5-ureidoimidazoline decarboxylase n=1 Tax=Penicillium canariense TaxID=189055 RepID=A0A9W9LJR5_9EURO|nr:Oxo-4-hydroxy-4-carboxy-5-ureidoimidazoline decarboxylase [Penicillium canariense]KAJ5160024.1 Oxo-4-hydroxy-4-carboxy-5-ureidoimidazoline decarboxylase [Penicillium canariense]
MADLPALSSLPSQSQETQLRVLDTLFEPSPELHRLMIPVLANQTFASYDSLIDAVWGRMSALSAPNSPTDRDVLFGILGSHPRLGRAPANPEHLSELSKKEQEQLNTGAEEQAEKLLALNAEYEAQFPGLRTFVNGRSRDMIMVEMRQRIDRADAEKEITETIQSGSSNSQQDAQRTPRRPQPIDGPLARKPSVTPQETKTETSAIDPLSQHIIQRTNTQKSIPLKLLGRASYEADAGSSGLNLSESSAVRGDAMSNSKAAKEKKNRVSFLSRIIGTKKKKDQPSEAEDELLEADASPMPINASHPIGFIPQHPAPARYLKTRAHYKRDKDFDKVFLAQELLGGAQAPPRAAARRRSWSTSSGVPNDDSTGKAIWALVFSKDGKYLAAAGQEKKVRVWEVISTPEERRECTGGEEDAPAADQPPRLKAPVFKSNPVQILEGHTGSILDLSWSKNNFILSSSMDKTVRLWHVSRSECLCCFQHSDFVTSIQFHPRDDRFFLAGSLDTKLRLWNIPDKRVAFVTTVPDMITAVSFTPDGRNSMAGCLNGLLNIYETEGLRASGQIHVRSARGRNAKGHKITGIDTMTVPSDDPNGEIKVLVTSNDSRIRMYDFRTRVLEAKFRGNENTCSQIRATFTDDGKHVICGSEDRRAYLWPIGAVERDAGKRAVEVFEPQSAIVTVALSAPTKTKQILGLSEDPIYDICNPPPVALMSAEESSKQESPERENGSNYKRASSARRLSIISKLAHQSPSYISRSKHEGGNIIVLADYSGKIKVLRQDCAYQKRRYENWNANSTISRRILRRSNSARHSLASSGKESTHKTPSEHIVSWRNSVVRHGHPSNEGSRPSLRTHSPSSHHRPATFRLSSSRPSSLGPNETLSLVATSPPPSPRRSRTDTRGDDTRPQNGHGRRPSQPSSGTTFPSGTHPSTADSTDPRKLPTSTADIVTSGKNKDNPLWLQGDHSYAFWNKITHDALAMHSRKSNDLVRSNSIASGAERKLSTAESVLSSEYESSTGGEEDIMKCERCQGTNFRGVKGRDGTQKLICVQCNRSIG